MLSIAGIIFIVAIIIAIDVPPLWRKKLIKELWIFSLLLSFGTVLAIMQALHIKVLNPLDLIITIYKPVANMVDVWLK